MKKKNNIFTDVQMPNVPSSVFDLSHDVKLSFNMGNLIPTCVMEVLPGDRFRISPENMLRFAPLVSPVMHRIRVATHYFFVPNRLLWPNWDEWISGNLDVEHPYMDVSTIGFAVRSLADYLGYPTESTDDAYQVSPFPVAAYWMIFNEYYRDQNLVDEVSAYPLVDGENDGYASGYANLECARRAWHHDYFTSALPFAQKGQPVQLPLTQNADVPVQWTALTSVNGFSRWRDPMTGDIETGNLEAAATTGRTTAGGNLTTYDPNGSLVVNVQAEAVDINTLRRAFRLQEFLEKDARGGTRYIENIMSHFGVRSSDARLQRPEYIGGMKQNMVISEVLNMAQNMTEEAVVGAMAGHGVSVGGGNTFGYYAEEHGWIIGITSVMPDTSYQQGLHRSLTRFDRLDYAWPEFSQIGEQEILVKELMIGGLDTEEMNGIFGYIPRYSEYKYINSRVAGDFKSTLSFWHLGRIFENDEVPELNSDFIECVPRTDIFAVEDGSDTIYAHVINNITCKRKLPRFGIPTI